jgi:hypothetical protein
MAVTDAAVDEHSLKTTLPLEQPGVLPDHCMRLSGPIGDVITTNDMHHREAPRNLGYKLLSDKARIERIDAASILVPGDFISARIGDRVE